MGDVDLSKIMLFKVKPPVVFTNFQFRISAAVPPLHGHRGACRNRLFGRPEAGFGRPGPCDLGYIKIANLQQTRNMQNLSSSEACHLQASEVQKKPTAVHQ